MKHRKFPTMITAALSLVAGIMIGCKSAPISKLERQQVRRIEIQNQSVTTALIDSPQEIAFITSRLKGLSTHRDFKIRTEFEILLHLGNGESVHLRMGRECIGPNVPASQRAKRWYFANSELYDFIASKATGPKQ